MVKPIAGIPIPPPPPMPSVRPALVQMEFAREAIERGCNAWSRSQVEDAIASARRFLDAAESQMRATA